MLRFCAAAALLTTLSFSLPALPALSALPALPAPPVISAANYLSHIRYLASDSLGGRGNGSEGLQRAGDYIASLLDSGGLQPAGDNSTFFQSFDGEMTVEPPPSATLIIRAGAHAETFTAGEQYYPLSIIDRTHGEAAPVAERIPMVFAGYGMTAPALGYDDFKNLDVRGKAVIVFTHEPQEADARSVFDGTSLTPGAAVATKAREAMARGAAMLIVVDDPSHHADYAFNRAWWNDPQSDDMGIPVVRVARTRLARALPDVDFERLARTIDITLTPQSRELAGATKGQCQNPMRGQTEGQGEPDDRPPRQDCELARIREWHAQEREQARPPDAVVRHGDPVFGSPHFDAHDPAHRQAPTGIGTMVCSSSSGCAPAPTASAISRARGGASSRHSSAQAVPSARTRNVRTDSSSVCSPNGPRRTRWGCGKGTIA